MFGHLHSPLDIGIEELQHADLQREVLLCGMEKIKYVNL